MAEYAMESVIRGHHVYKRIWQPRLGEQLALDVRYVRFVRRMRLTNVW